MREPDQKVVERGVRQAAVLLFRREPGVGGLGDVHGKSGVLVAVGGAAWWA